MRAALLAAAATASAVRPIDAAPRWLAAKTGPEAPAWCTTSRVRSEAEPPRFAFVRGFGGTGTGLLARVLGTHTRISTMTHTTAMYEDEGQYLQSAMPEIRKRTAESCGGSIAVCPRIVDTLPRDARVNVCAGWAPWWDATKDVLVEKTPDLALAALSAIFPARYEAAAIVVLRHPYFWHHKRHCPSHDAGCLLARVPRPRRLCVASTASTTQDAWIGAIKGALAPAMPLRLIVVRYEDLVLRTPEVSRALFAALNLPPTSRRRLALRGATTSPEHLWAFSAHAGGQPYAAAVHKCLADPRFTADVGRRLRGPLLAATGYDALRVDGADFVPLDTDLLASSLGPRFRAWLRSPATNRAAAMPPCASDVRVGRPLSVLRRAGACHQRDPSPRRPRAVRRRNPRPTTTPSSWCRATTLLEFRRSATRWRRSGASWGGSSSRGAARELSASPAIDTD